MNRIVLAAALALSVTASASSAFAAISGTYQGKAPGTDKPCTLKLTLLGGSEDQTGRWFTYDFKLQVGAILPATGKFTAVFSESDLKTQLKLDARETQYFPWTYETSVTLERDAKGQLVSAEWYHYSDKTGRKTLTCSELKKTK